MLKTLTLTIAQTKMNRLMIKKKQVVLTKMELKTKIHRNLQSLRTKTMRKLQMTKTKVNK